jgi:O-antigen/teichoic acid export membrane protein
LVQLVSIPAAYRSLGREAFAAYAAVTSIVVILTFFNLGLGGAMVSPLAQARASRDVNRERQVVAASLVPLAGLAGFAAIFALPLIVALPLHTLFGEAASSVNPRQLRIAAFLACSGTLAALPLSVATNARQAYQELHVSYAITTVSNIVMAVGILLVAFLHPTLVSFVAVRVLVPLLGQLSDLSILIYKRPYLLRAYQFFSVAGARATASHGIYFLAASSTSTLLYEWSIYLMTRMRPPTESARFAVCMQIILLAMSFFVGLAQPVWGATADACATGDHVWVKAAIRRVRMAAVAYGVAAALGFGFLLNVVVGLWLRRPVTFEAPERWLAGAYVLLAAWEYGHWTLSLGQGRMKPASLAILTRALAFSVSAPFVVRFGPQGILWALCGSIALCTSWYYPRLVSRSLGMHA